MLLSEASSPDLEKRKGIIERLAADLQKNGIKFQQKGSTALDIFNGVTSAQPIYTAVANKNGAFDLIDKSVERAKLTRMPNGAYPLFGDYNDKGKLVSLHQSEHGSSTGYFEGNNGIGMRHVYNSGGIDIMNSDLIYRAKNDEIEYGHEDWDSELKDVTLVRIDIIRNGQLVTQKKPGKRELKANPNARTDWLHAIQNFYGKRLANEELYDAALQYIVGTISSTTVNAAIKSGKDKYMIKPAKELLDILEDIFSSKVIDNNFDEVSNENAEHPIIQFTPCDYITIKINCRRPTLAAKGVQFVVTNTDKTLLYADIRKNNDNINTFGYEIPVGNVTIWSEKDDNKRILDYTKIGDVARLIVNYVKANKALAVQAAEIKAKTTAFNQKVNTRAAAEKERIAKEVEKAHARLDRRDAAKQLKNPNKVDDVASSLWGSDEEYDKFLDSLL